MLDEMGRLVESKIAGKIFKIDTILSDPFRAARVFAGSTSGARKAVLETLNGLFPPRRGLAQEKFDVVVYGVPHWSPYAIFSFMNPLLTLISSGLGYLGGTVQALGKPGCTVIMVTPCPDEWDRVHHASYPQVWDRVLGATREPFEIMNRFAGEYEKHEGFIKKYRNEYAFHPVHAILASYPLRRLAHIGRVIVVGSRDPKIPAHIGFDSAATMEDAFARCGELHGPNFSVGYVDQPTTPSKHIL
jgi:hypothetical protein